MAKSTASTPANRSDALDVTPGTLPVDDGEQFNVGANLLAAWQGVYHLFGGRAKFRFEDGVITAHDFTTDAPYDPNQIIQDISHRNRRLEFTEVYPWFNGEAPEPFTDAKQITAWTVQFLRGSVEDNSSRTPKYVRDATANYKTSNSFAKKRGPKKKVFRAENIGEIGEDVLAGVDPAELAKLRAAVEAAIAASQSNGNGESSDSTTKEAATA